MYKILCSKSFNLRFLLKYFFLSLMIVTQSLSVSASEKSQIAAIVNDEIVSAKDLHDRIKLYIVSSGGKYNQETIKRYVPRVLNILISERLKLQEAARRNIKMDQDKVLEAYRNVAQKNKKTEAQFDTMLKSAGVNKQTLLDQIEVNLIWSKYVSSVLPFYARVTENDVQNYLDVLEARKGKEEYRLAEIFLGVNQSSPDKNVKKMANHIVKQVKSGANFQVLARQFSEGPEAASGGDMGWVHLEDLEPEVSQAVQNTQKGSLLGPIRSRAGYHIVVSVNKRVAPVDKENLPDRKAVKNQIYQKKLNLAAKRKLNAIKRGSNIVYKLKK